MNNDVTTKHTKGTKNKAYPKYKPSGVEWLGDVPEHWGVKKLKHTANLYGRIGFRGYTTDDLVDEGEGAITLSPSNMKDGELHLEKSTYISWEKYYESPEIVIRPEDVVIVKTGSTFGKISYVRQVEHPITLNPQLAVFKSLKCNNRFFFFYIGAPYIQDQISLSNTGSTIPTMTQQTIMSYAIPLPPLPEQQAIAAFLDRETGRIDSLIAKKQRLLELLAEQRTALISRAVTKGLDATVKLKPSGVEWLGDVPEHWGVKRLKHVFPRLLSGVSTNSENNQADEIELGVLKTSCVYGNTFIPSENKKIVDDEISRASCPVRKNSLIISRMNTPELVGNCGYVDRDYFNLFLPDRLWIATFTIENRIIAKYAWYIIISDAYVKLTGTLATGTSDSMKNLSQDAFLNMEIPLPPLSEQQAIAAFLDRETAKIDTLSAKVVAVIERLKEYRTALISSTVTGKIDVRGSV